ncbi:MAG: thiamine pyrophosphate-dependent dehydrogenase E1 component subunit alpha [Planctomycetes bacterium]|nr:thiamine pyrophosphate-dependent dehydrogenase E1 component subunit alpha [Planctomycetota bacterium]
MNNPQSHILLDLYGKMLLARSFEFTHEREFRKGNLPGSLHTALGHEAVVAAVAQCLRKTDKFFCDQRSSSLHLLAGMPGERFLAELAGKETGVCRGRGGMIHSVDPSIGSFAGSSVIGQILVVSLGVAMGLKMDRTDNITVVIVGDGASGRGEWHECMNLASTWKAPLVICCANNGYAISTPVAAAHATADLYEYAAAYRMPAVQVDGNDALASYNAVRDAVAHARSGNGPAFVELKTWRWDPCFSGEMRSPEEVHYWREVHEPLRLARQAILAEGLADEAQLDALHAATDAQVAEWWRFAQESPLADPSIVTANVYAGWEVETR